MDAKTVSVKLETSMHNRIKQLAEARHRTAHWVMRDAIQKYVESEERREALRQATLAAWQEYKETGLHVTAEEADKWLGKLVEGKYEEPPVCHP
jgi:predicted transcriptional regulator